MVEHSIDGNLTYEDADECYITTGEEIELYHSEEGKPSEGTKGDKPMAEKEKTVGDVFNELTDEQKKVVAFMIGEAVKKAKAGEDVDDEDDEESVFELPVESFSEQPASRIVIDISIASILMLIFFIAGHTPLL